MCPFRLSTVSAKGYTGKKNYLSMHPSEARSLSPYPSNAKDDDFNFIRVLQLFLALAMYPFALKDDKKNNFLISQNEIGMLAIFSKYSTDNFDEQYYLLQKKFEPGNDPISQLSPAIQMTYSNLKGKHGGRINNLNFIKNLSLKANFSNLQLEQSDSFLHKKNLNYFGLLENNELPDFFKCIDLFWLSSREI